MEQRAVEEVVWTECEDGFRLSGLVIRPASGAAKPVALVYLPGWDLPFFHPTYVRMGRALAGHGYLSVVGHHRSWPFGEIMRRDEEFVMTGAAWERFSECPLDIGPWVEFAASLGAQRVALLGHSFGGAKAVYYQANRQDSRVAALILASPGPLQFLPIAPEVIAEAERLVAQGRGNELLPWGSVWQFTLSAQTLLEQVPERQTPLDVFGISTPEPTIAQIRGPLLVFYGSKEGSETAARLEQIQRNASAAQVETRLIEEADHLYSGREQDVASVVAAWLDATL